MLLHIIALLSATSASSEDGAGVGGTGLTLKLFNNTGFAEAPYRTSVIPAFDFSMAGGRPGSATVTGTMTAVPGMQYVFSCDFGDSTVATLHIDDHLVCQQGANVGNGCGAPADPKPCSGIAGDNPLPTMTRTALPVRLDAMHNGSAAVPIQLKVTVTATAAPCIFNCTMPKADATAGAVAREGSAERVVVLSPEMPALEEQRRAMQHALLQGWGLFYDMSYTDHVLLPNAARLNLAICKTGTDGSCLTEARIDWPDKSASSIPADIRLGMHAYDRSYNQLYVAVDGKCNVSIAATGGTGADLLVAVEVVAMYESYSSNQSNSSNTSSGGGNGAAGSDAGTDAAAASDGCDGYALVPTGYSTWFRANTITSDGTSLVFDSYGLGVTTIYATEASDDTIAVNTGLVKGPHLTYKLRNGFKIGLNSGKAPLSMAEIETKVQAAALKEAATYTRFGDLAETKEAVQSAVMWQLIWNPLEAGPLAPVIRGNPWGLDKDPATDDWAYVVFDWDNHFGAYMLSLDAKELGYSALIQVVKSKTNQGFVPNTAASVNKAHHSQPPVGSKILLEMYKKHNDTWMVQLLFDDLYDWNTWYNQSRRLAPLNMIALGAEEGDMQDARYESGLDNSPMYDVTSCTAKNGTCSGVWNCSNGSCGCFKDQKMQLYDVGMASMHTMDSAALAVLATAIGRTAEAAILSNRATEMQQLIDANLWDEASGIYVNKVPDGGFYRRVSPTSFYAMQTAGPSNERVDTMMKEWMMNPKHFCVTENGDFKGNADACYWGLPSIEASDAAFPTLGYWRGYVWGPMAQLTFWGLQNYDHVPSARTARKALCKQMNGMMLEQWRAHRRICENYYPAKGHVGCSPGAMQMYHWGALAGFVSLIDEGYY